MRRLTALFLACSLVLVPCQASAKIVISEVFWMGSDLSTADEWLEITSLDPPGSVQSLSGWTITSLASNGSDAVIARFGASQRMEGGSYAVISNYAADASRLATVPLLTSTAMSLPNTKLRLRLRNASGAIVDEVDDGIGAPFAGTNVTGQPKASMERVSLTGSGTLPTNWMTAVRSQGFDEGFTLLGTPGFAREISSDPEPIIQEEPYPKAKEVVVISEVLPDPIGDDAQEWTELRNAGSGALNLAEWKLKAGSTVYTFPASTILGTGAFLLLPRALTKLTLVNAGGTVSLADKAGTEQDAMTYGALPEGVSAGHLSPSDPVMPYCSPTPGLPNEQRPPKASIDVQQGSLYGIGKLSINVQALFDVPASRMQCRWDFGDGTTSESCNPASHTYTDPGPRNLTLKATDYCSTTVIQSLDLFIAEKSIQVAKQCIPTTFTGVTLSEFLPSPQTGEEEWAELYNASTETANLCGWSLDDEAGGSAPFRMDALSIPPQSFFLVPQRVSHLMFNNDGDTVRLGAPLAGGGTGIILEMPYPSATQGQSLVIHEGKVVLSLTPTPGYGNVLPMDTSFWALPHVIVRSALPNPSGKDPGQEWLEIENLSGRPQWMNGWQVQAGSSTMPLQGMVLAAGESRRFYTGDRFSLRNSTGSIALRSPSGQAVSLLAWNKAQDGQVIAREKGERVTGWVKGIQDGSIVFQPEEKGSLVRVVHLRGVDDALDSVGSLKNGMEKLKNETISALLKDKKVDLYLYTESEEASLERDGKDIASYLLQEGTAVANRKAVEELPELMAFQVEAIRKGKGIWADPVMSKRILAQQADWKLLQKIAEKGYSLTVSAKSGIVSSGAIVTLKSTLPSTLLVSVNDEPYRESSGTLVITADTKMKAYAVPILFSSRADSEIHSDVETRIFLTAKEVYPDSIRVSEVYPSPPKGQQEWIELYNDSEETVSIGGWKLIPADGKAKLLPLELTIAPHEYKVLTSVITHLKLKNDGTNFSLASPDGVVVERVRYPKIKTGYSYMINNNSALMEKENSVSGCVSTVATPMTANKCVLEQKKAKAPKKKSTKSISSRSKSAAESVMSVNPMMEGMRGQIVNEQIGSTSSSIQDVSTSSWIFVFISIVIVIAFLFFRKLRMRNLS